MVGYKKECDMCNSDCCCTNVPVRDNDHAKCHCGDTHWCESPVIEKHISNCNDGCCVTTTTSIRNSDEVVQYVDGLRDEHCGCSEHDLCRTIDDISKVSNTCCTPSPPCKCGKGCDKGCGCNNPALYYEELNCSTANAVSCCSDANSNVAYIRGLANRVRGSMQHSCHTYGDIRETVKEIPAANVFLVNHEFIDLLIDEIRDCLPHRNISDAVVCKVKDYVDLYYIYYKDIELVGSLVLNNIVSIDKNLITDPVVVARTKAILYTLDQRLKGKINVCER